MSHAYVTSFSSLNEIQPDSNHGIMLKKKVIEKKNELGFETHEG